MKKLIIAIATLTLGTALMANTTTGSGEGYNGDILVEVTRDGDKITAVEVVDHSDTPGIAKRAISRVTGAIIEAQSTEVDTVAGATYTSEGIIQAVEDALSK
ncbi:hypothetical protein PM10SUCC1_05040 [Propionigenium maris DSM 9537]|uniref:FMN-binding domain-containing protein n=1 Tax=Propionigenium maris DSM 9537 TaxID=1123000 RepID=A0A9W6GJF0_9FUSO|nr:FMN-binding protein [Propionigenium maris]GLI54989.1 hypothetical protein PM10SUCC1_05040 [Propionigenium maris DSM 9537]